ncbi:MAG: flagellar hook-length control protein FliK, partial [Undibacterium sp.]|nr:flagellar hook-length control protein FliK [Undibacterium sp.]
ESSTPTLLSKTGLLINQLLQNTQSTSQNIENKRPILVPDTASEVESSPQQHAKMIEERLHNDIEKSGLFYESHVALWSRGKLPLPELMQEPQAKLGEPVNSNAPNLNTEELPGTLAPLMQQQLDALENQKVVLQTWLTSQIPVQVSINEDSQQNKQNKDAVDQSTNWQSQIKVDLPYLGVVTINIHLHEEHVGITVKGAQEHAADILNTHFEELSLALQNAGTHLTSFNVSHEP